MDSLADETKIHETASNRWYEEVDVATFARYNGLKYKMMERLSTRDAQLFLDGRLLAIAEAKRRTHTIDDYPTFKIDRKKLVRLVEAAESLQVKALLLVRFDQLLCVLALTREMLAGFKSEPFKRRDRDERVDNAACIPVAMFEKV